MQQWGDASMTLGLILAALSLGCAAGPLLLNTVVPPRPAALAWGVAAAFAIVLVGFLLTLLAGSIAPLLLATFVRELSEPLVVVWCTLPLAKAGARLRLWFRPAAGSRGPSQWAGLKCAGAGAGSSTAELLPLVRCCIKLYAGSVQARLLCSQSLPLSEALLALPAACAAGTDSLCVFSTLLLQLRVPNSVLGRMTALESALQAVAEAASSVFAGAATDVLHLTTHQALAGLTVAAGVAAGMWAAFAAVGARCGVH